MADAIFSWFKKNIANCSIDLNNDTIKVMLVTALSAPDQNAHTKHLTFRVRSQAPATPLAGHCMPIWTSSRTTGLKVFTTDSSVDQPIGVDQISHGRVMGRVPSSRPR